MDGMSKVWRQKGGVECRHAALDRHDLSLTSVALIGVCEKPWGLVDGADTDLRQWVGLLHHDSNSLWYLNSCLL